MLKVDCQSMAVATPRPRFLTALAVGALCLWHSSGCRRPVARTEQTPTADASAVKVVRPQKRDIRRLIERPGFNIEPYEQTPLYAKIAGYVRSWNFDIGDSVRKGDVLAEIYIPE